MAVEPIDALNDCVTYADWEETGSVTRAKAFITAVNRYLLLSPQSQSDQGQSLAISVTELANMRNRAQVFVAQSVESGSGASVRFLGVSQVGFRQ